MSVAVVVAVMRFFPARPWRGASGMWACGVWEWLRVSIGIEALASRHIPYILDACQDWHELAQYGPPYWRPRSEAELQRKIAATSGPVPGVEYNFVLADDGGDAGVPPDVGGLGVGTRGSSGVSAAGGVASLGANLRLIGECSLHAIDWRNRVAQVDVCIWNPNDRHHGYGQQAMKFLTEWSAKQLGLQRLEAWILANNVASQQLATRFGFEYEGRLRGRYQLNGERHDVEILGWTVS